MGEVGDADATDGVDVSSDILLPDGSHRPWLS